MIICHLSLLAKWQDPILNETSLTTLLTFVPRGGMHQRVDESNLADYDTVDLRHGRCEVRGAVCDLLRRISRRLKVNRK